MSRSFQIYDAICDVCAVIDGFGECTISKGANPVTEELGIPNFQSSWKTYVGYLYNLYDLAEREGLLVQVLDLMAPSECVAFKDVCEEKEEESSEAKHQAIMDDVEIGDLVRLANGDAFYVADIDGKSLWVTKDATKRSDADALGWSADLYDVVEILEKNNEW